MGFGMGRKVVKFPRHKFHGAWCCDQGMNDYGDFACVVCRSGLAWCETCGTCEGSLPTHCPGFILSPAQELAIMNGKLDYKNGRWLWKSRYQAKKQGE